MTAEGQIERAGVESRRRWRSRVSLALLGLVFGSVLLGLALSFRERPKIDVLSPDVKLESKEPLPDRWIPKGWKWAWRVKEAVLGKPKWAWIEPRILNVADFDGLARRLPKPDYSRTNGIRVWVLGQRSFATVTNMSFVAEDPRIAVGVFDMEFPCRKGMKKTVSTVGMLPWAVRREEVWLFCDVVPDRTRRATDLTAVVHTRQQSTPYGYLYWGPAHPQTQTNSAFAVRMRIPDGGGVLIVEELRPGQRKVMALAVDWEVRLMDRSRFRPPQLQ